MNSRYVDSCNGPLLVAVYKEVVILKVVKPHRCSKKEKGASKRNNFMGSFGGTQQK